MALPEVDPAQYDAQLQSKSARLQQMLAKFSAPELEVFSSPPKHYRMRAEFRTWHDEDELHYVMFQPGSKHDKVFLSECPMVSERIHSVMFALLEALKAQKELRYRLFQVDFLSTLSGELLVSLLYHRAIGAEWEAAVRPLRERFAIDIVGRSRKHKAVLDRDFVLETLNIRGRDYQFKQTENSFTQPNAEVNRKMITWALAVTDEVQKRSDLLEFYCGNGNFTLPLAQNFRRVLATEISKESVRSAEYNIAVNAIDNIDVLRMPSEDLVQVLRGEKETRKVAGLDLAACDFQTVFVDPPRAGLDAQTVSQVAEYPTILYISCNPETLVDNLESLCRTHQIERCALFDQFPYTHHMEAGVFLRRRVE